MASSRVLIKRLVEIFSKKVKKKLARGKKSSIIVFVENEFEASRKVKKVRSGAS